MHLIGIPLTGTSVNPARSLGPAVFAGGEPLAHVWLFLLAPMVGGALAVVVRLLAVPSLTVERAGVVGAADETGAQLPEDELRTGGPGPSDAQLPRARASTEADTASGRRRHRSPG